MRPTTATTTQATRGTGRGATRTGRPGARLLTLVLTVLPGALAPRAGRAQDAVAAPVAAPSVPAAVPFAVGEELTYRAIFGRVRAGTARMRVAGIEVVRGRPAYHVVFSFEGGIPFFRVRDRYESWIDVETLASLRHRQEIAEGRYKRTTTYEIYPERAEYRRNDGAPEASVGNPLDEGSFLYAVRAAAVAVGETRREDRYFRPDRNPVLLTGVRRDTVTVPAGSYPAVVVAPSIRTKGIFAEGGEALVWFSDDAHRYPVQVKSRFAGFGVTLVLQSVTRGGGVTVAERAATRHAPRGGRDAMHREHAGFATREGRSAPIKHALAAAVVRPGRWH